jgi:hypothetical protein
MVNNSWEKSFDGIGRKSRLRVRPDRYGAADETTESFSLLDGIQVTKYLRPTGEGHVSSWVTVLSVILSGLLFVGVKMPFRAQDAQNG